MAPELHIRRALVTASSAGIGRAIAVELARAGADVVVHGRSPATAEVAATELHAVDWISGDLATTEGTEQVRSWLADNDIDVLVNGAGPFAENTYETASPQNWADTYQSNVISAITLARTALPGMHTRGFGRVIFIGTRATRTPIPTMIEYSAAKAALANATISLARSAGGPDVTVNMVSPGVILTPSLKTMFSQRPEYEDMAWEDIEPQITSQYASNPTGRLGRPEDIAKAVAFIAGASSSYINGVDLPVDGGLTGTH